MKQTAVEWLIEQLFELRNPTLNQIEIMKQAKEMEREQLIDCGNSCAMRQHIHIERINDMTMEQLIECSKEETLTFGEEYYNQTYKE